VAPPGEPGELGELLLVVEPADVADLGDEHRGEGRADPADLLDHPIPAMSPEPMVDHRPEQLNLCVVGIDQLQQGQNALAVDQIQRRRAQPRHPRDPEHIGHLRDQTLLGQRPVHLGLQPRPERGWPRRFTCVRTFVACA
jgi:hypothetical protein